MEVDGSQRAMPRASVEDRQLSMNDLKAANNKFAGYTLFFYIRFLIPSRIGGLKHILNFALEFACLVRKLLSIF